MRNVRYLMMAGTLILGLVVTLSTPQKATACEFDNSGHKICLGGTYTKAFKAPVGHRRARYDGGQLVSHPNGCPWRLFCGCGTSVRVFGRPIRHLFLASNWKMFPPTTPHRGAVAWRSGHVFYIESMNADGTVLAYDPNSGHHGTRIHNVSLRGYHIVDPYGARLASR